MSSEKREPQSFAAVIGDADSGRVDKILSADLARVIDAVTDKATLHSEDWKGEISLKIKVVAEPHGKVTLSFGKTVKIDEEKMPKARFYFDPDEQILTVDQPKQVKIPGFDSDGKSKATKSAAAPKPAGKTEE